MGFGSGPKGPTAEELVKQKEVDKAAAEAETAKIEAERQLEKDKANAKVLADNKAMADADAAKRERQKTLLNGVLALDEEDDKDTLPDGTPMPTFDEEKPKRKKSKTLLQTLSE